MNQPMINWSEVPTGREPMLKLMTPPMDGILELWVLCERECGVFTHWHPTLKRNQPCTDPYGCICREMQVNMSWRAYLGCYDPRAKKNRIADLTADAWRDANLMQWVQNRGGLRGLKLVLSRFPHTKNGKQVVKVYEPSVDQRDSLPPAFNVKDELQRIWFVRI